MTLFTEGEAFIFDHDGTAWTETARLDPILGGGTDSAGHSVALSGDVAVVGILEEISEYPYYSAIEPKVQVFQLQNDAWVEILRLDATDGWDADYFGRSVATSGDEIFVAAPAYEGLDPGTGKVYVFEGPGSESVGPFNLDSFCFGAGESIPGCTPCPCANDAPPGSTGGCLNSSQSSARLALTGLPSTSTNLLRFLVSGANPSTFGVLLSGDSALPNGGPCPFGSGISGSLLDGLRCVGQGVLRHGARATDTSGAIGLNNAGWGPPDGPPGGIANQGGFVTGQTRYFQVFYREDDTLVCSTGQNTTNAKLVTFTFAP